MDVMADIIFVRVEWLELVYQLPLCRLERLAGRNVEIARNLVHHQETK
jgi:hypothetical protein